MRVLVLDEWLPVPPDSGKRLRSYELLKRLAGRHQITWLAPAQPSEDPGPARSRMESDGFRVETLTLHRPGRGDASFYLRAAASILSRLPYVVQRHRSRALRERIQSLHRQLSFDLLHVEWTPLSANRPETWDRPWVVVAHNLESKIWARLSQVGSVRHERAFFALEARRMERFERRVFRDASAVVGVSEQECEVIRSWGGRAWCVENGVDLERLRASGRPEEPVLLFTGALDWQANLDAVDYFLKELWPGIRARCPGLRWRIVGRRPPEEWKRRVESQPGVEVHASVPDVRPYFEAAAVVVVPLRVGGGTRLKILEALAMEKAVVSTCVGAEGLEIVAGEDYVCAETPEEWAEAVAGLLEQPSRRADLGASGRRRILERYGWDTLASKLEQVWLEQTRGSGA